MQNRSLPLSFLPYALALLLMCGIFTAHQLRLTTTVANSDAEQNVKPTYTIVLDAGHGGEDGGASASDGTLEKDLNLAMAFQLKEILESNGVKVVLTRESDTLLYDRNVDFQGRKKALDMAERIKIAQSTENCIFISLHMNTYPMESCQGLQVWYSENDSLSRVLAAEIQEAARLLQPQNERQCKAAKGNIYLLRKLSCPAVLIECGFLSNPNEAERLKDAEYQKQLSLTIFSAVMKCLSDADF